MTHRPRPVLRRVLRATGAVVGTLVALVAAAVLYLSVAYAERIGPNVFVASVEVGGRTRDEATGLLAAALAPLADVPVTLVGAEGITESIAVTDAGVTYDVPESVGRAFAIGRRSNPFVTAYDVIRELVGAPIVLEPVVTYQRSLIEERLNALSERLGDGAHDTELVVKRGVLGLTPDRVGRIIDRDAVLATLAERLATFNPDRTIPFEFVDHHPTVSKADAEQLLPQLRPILSESLVLTVPDRAAISVEVAEVARWVTFTRVDRTSQRPWVLASAMIPTAGPSTVVAAVDETDLAAYLTTLAKQLDVAPVDAKLNIQNGKATVFAASQSGRSLNQPEALRMIAGALSDRALDAGEAALSAPDPSPRSSTLTPLALPTETTEPTVTSAAVSQLGINELIGRGETDFAGSPENRIHNLTTGTDYLSGQLVKPGGEFSTVSALGAVDASTGYLPELVIKENKTIPEFGGGLCQVSTTLFRAVLSAGLPITERQSHSYRVSYYERGVGPGLDATVYLPRPDLKFRNDTSGWILVQGMVNGKKLSFELYGTKDGRVSAIDGPHTLATQEPPPDTVTEDPNLQPGERIEVQKRHVGATTVATYTVTRNGEEINRQVFTSKYRAIPAEFRVGPTAPPEPVSPPVSE